MNHHAYPCLIAAMVAALLSCTPVRADSMPEATAALVDLAVVLPGLALSVPNLVHVAERRRPPLGWPVTGLALGVVGAGLSTVLLADMKAHDKPTFAIAGLAGSAIEIVFAIWAWALPDDAASLAATSRGHDVMTIRPLLGVNSRSRPIYGVSVSGFGF